MMYTRRGAHLFRGTNGGEKNKEKNNLTSEWQQYARAATKNDRSRDEKILHNNNNNIIAESN